MKRQPHIGKSAPFGPGEYFFLASWFGSTSFLSFMAIRHEPFYIGPLYVQPICGWILAFINLCVCVRLAYVSLSERKPFGHVATACACAFTIIILIAGGIFVGCAIKNGTVAVPPTSIEGYR